MPRPSDKTSANCFPSSGRSIGRLVKRACFSENPVLETSMAERGLVDEYLAGIKDIF